MSTATPADRPLLARAVAVAATVAGTTSPNPNVGCVLARDGEVLAQGASAPAGGPHAEVVALQRAGAAARGATAYVTLEPCAHQGRTPPCTEALLAAGVARVVIAHPDPHPVAAGGADRLRAAGVEVVGPLEPGDLVRRTVAAQLEGFLTVVGHGRPHVTLKLAQTADGVLVGPGPDRWITGELARRAVHRWRAAVDAVVVGSGTVLADDPRLDVRLVATPRCPRPVVFDGRLRTPPDAQVVQRGALIVTRPDAPVARRKALLGAGADVVDVPGGRSGGLDLPAALESLADHGIATVLAEPGATLARALIDADLVDRLVLHVALGSGGGEARRAVPGPPGDPWVTERSGGAGGDLVLHLVPASRRSLAAGGELTEGP